MLQVRGTGVGADDSSEWETDARIGNSSKNFGADGFCLIDAELISVPPMHPLPPSPPSPPPSSLHSRESSAPSNDEGMGDERSAGQSAPLKAWAQAAEMTQLPTATVAVFSAAATEE